MLFLRTFHIVFLRQGLSLIWAHDNRLGWPRLSRKLPLSVSSALGLQAWVTISGFFICIFIYLKIYFTCIYFALYVCRFTMCRPGARRGWKRVSHRLKLGLQMAVSQHVGAGNGTQIFTAEPSVQHHPPSSI